jgi:hypothetical protein
MIAMNQNSDMRRERRKLLKASAILRYFIGGDDQLETLIMCKPSDIGLFCYDQSLYEALGSLRDYDEFDFRKLVKFIESVDVISYKAHFRMNERPILTEGRVEVLRSKALRGSDLSDETE